MIPQPPPRRAAPVIALVAAAVLLAGAAVWMLVAADSAADAAETAADRLAEQARRVERTAENANLALVDPAATDDVTTQVRAAVEATFSYDHTDLKATEKAVDRYLADDARCAYDQLFGEVRQVARSQRLVLATAVRDVAVVQLSGDRAEALVFFDQTSTRGDRNTTASSSGQFVAHAGRDGDDWRLTSLDFLEQPLINGESAPEC